MNYKNLEYSRNFNLGNYETERITLTVDVDPETENIYDCYKDLKAAVLSLQKEGQLIEESRKVAEVATRTKKHDLSKIKTERTEGPSGFYQKATEQDNEDYKKLLEDLKQHDGKITHDGMFVWLFSDSKTVGMKQSRK